MAVSLSLALLLQPFLARAQADPDNDNDPYDQATCSGIEEDDLAASDSTASAFPFDTEDLGGASSSNLGQDPYEFSPFPDNNFTLPFDSEGDSSSFSFKPTYTQDEQKRVNPNFFDEPKVSLNVSGSTATPGEEVTATINYDSFASTGSQTQDFYSIVFVDGVYLNGVMAGATFDTLEGLSRTVNDPAKPDCGTLNRFPEVDQDADGMDDNWEIRYGLNPNDAGDADQDPDQDGYVANAFPNLSGEFVNPAPPIEGGVLGDGTFTNREEYILGTDPGVADTDADGFSDEADAVGYGQHTFTFLADKSLTDGAYKIHVIVVGFLGTKNEDDEHIVKIDSEFMDVIAREQDALEVELTVETDIAKPGDVLVVRATPTGVDEHNLLLIYRWLIDDDLQMDQSGQGQRTLTYEIPDETLPGTRLTVKAEVINPNTGQLKRGQLEIIIGDNVLLNYNPNTVEKGSLVTVNALLTAGQSASDFLFNWFLDGVMLVKSSRLGADHLTFLVTQEGGDTHEVRLEVYERKDSVLFGQATQTLEVLSPEVLLELTPENPGAGQSATVQTIAKHFSTDSLVYRVTLDDQLLEGDGPQRTIIVGPAGTRHKIEAQVSSADGREVAQDNVEFIVGPISQLTANINNSGKLSAGLVNFMTNNSSSVLVVLGLALVSTGGILSYRKYFMGAA